MIRLVVFDFPNQIFDATPTENVGVIVRQHPVLLSRCLLLLYICLLDHPRIV